MLYLLHGTDTMKSREKLNSLIGTLLAKKPDAMLGRIGSEEFSEAFIDEHVESLGLFEHKSILVFDTVFENKLHKDVVLSRVKDLERSDNVFIILEGKLDAKSLTKLSKHAAKVQECTLTGVREKKSSFNIFSLSDAIGQRDRKNVWVLYQTGKMNNIADEEMHGILFWSVKNMILAKGAKNAKDAGMSPFVFKKAERYAQNYKKEELYELSESFVEMYHEARRGNVSFEIGLEQRILQLS